MFRTGANGGASGRLPRRGSKFLTAVSAVAAISLLAACGGGGGGANGGDGDSGEVTVATLRVDVQSQPSTLDPIALNDTPAQRVYRLVYDSLYDWDEETTEVAPMLAAAEPEANEDRTAYTVELRDDVTWHDGSPFTADDVVFTYEQVRAEDNASVWNSAISSLDKVTKVDDTTVEFSLSKPYTYFPEKLAMVPIISKAHGYQPEGDLAREMMGTGPFVFEEWVEGEKLVLTRNDDYYGETPALEGVEFHVVPEDATRVANLRNGTAHIVPELPPNLIESVEKGGANAEVVAENATRVYLYPNMQEGKVTADPAVRQAIAYAVDRKSIIDTVYSGAARSASTYLSYGSRYHDEELGLFYGDGGDTETAEEMLAEAEQTPSGKLNFVVNNLPALVDTATIIQRSLDEIGIEVEIEPLDFGAMVPRLIDQEYDLLLTTAPVSVTAGFAPDYPAIGLHSESVPNWNRFTNPEMDALLEAAQEAEPGEASEEAWRKVQELDLETLGQIQLVSAQYTEGYSDGLGDYEPSKLAWLHNIPTIGTN